MRGHERERVGARVGLLAKSEAVQEGHEQRAAAVPDLHSSIPPNKLGVVRFEQRRKRQAIAKHAWRQIVHTKLSPRYLFLHPFQKLLIKVRALPAYIEAKAQPHQKEGDAMVEQVCEGMCVRAVCEGCV